MGKVGEGLVPIVHAVIGIDSIGRRVSLFGNKNVCSSRVTGTLLVPCCNSSSRVTVRCWYRVLIVVP